MSEGSQPQQPHSPVPHPQAGQSQASHPQAPPPQGPQGYSDPDAQPANANRESATSATKSGGLNRLPWVIAWACSVLVAFLLGTQSNGVFKSSHPAATGTTPSADSAAPSAAASGVETVEPDVAEMLKKLPRRDPNDMTAQGQVDAKVVLIEWSDYRCPYCAAWHTQTLPKLQKYINDGTLRVEYRDYPIFGDQSMDTAIAARAAGKQGRFWQFQDAVFAAAPKSGHPDIPRTKLLEFGRAAGVPDMATFEADLANQQLKEATNNDAAKARELGLNGTPFFVINGGYINGARPTADFIKAVETAAKE